jgi:hypothetical protein
MRDLDPTGLYSVLERIAIALERQETQLVKKLDAIAIAAAGLNAELADQGETFGRTLDKIAEELEARNIVAGGPRYLRARDRIVAEYGSKYVHDRTPQPDGDGS